VVLLAAALQVGARPGGVFWPPPPFEVYGPPEYEGRWFQQQEDARGEHALGGHFLKLATQDKERLPDAIHHYREATRILPQWPEALVSLGAALLNLRDAKALEEAGRAFAFAVELRPTFIEGRLFYGEWLRGMGRHEESLAQFREVTVRQPWGRDYHVAMLNLGIVLADLGRYPEAGDWLVRAVQNRPGDANATERLAGLARGHHTHGDPADAAALLERGLKHAPESLPLLKELGAAYQKMGKLREATEVAERAARIARAAGNLAAAAQWEEAARKLRAMQAGG
ncbi:MAG: tetratricopeptide repeat protein, partial [Planctomycetota bacterium]